MIVAIVCFECNLSSSPERQVSKDRGLRSKMATAALDQYGNDDAETYPSTSAARTNKTTAAPTAGKPLAASRRNDDTRDCPCVSINPHPSRNPAAAETTIAVSSKAECAVTNVKKLAA